MRGSVGSRLSLENIESLTEVTLADHIYIKTMPIEDFQTFKGNLN